jgi:hypothetical protein
VETYGKEIIKNKLYYQFIAHLGTLQNFGILTAQDVYQNIDIIQVHMNKPGKSKGDNAADDDDDDKTPRASVGLKLFGFYRRYFPKYIFMIEFEKRNSFKRKRSKSIGSILYNSNSFTIY